VAQLEALHRPTATRRHFPRRLRALAAAGAFVALTPLALLAAGPTFSDLNSASPEHRGNIQAIGNAGITTGFADPNNTGQRLYDPKANVTREEMASFLARTAGLGGNPPVANAATLQGYGPGDFARAALGSGPGAQDVPAGFGPLARLPFTAPSGGLVVVYATVVLSGTTGGTDPYADVAVSLREETTDATKLPRTVRVGTGPGAVGKTTITVVETFGVGPGGGNLSFVLQGSAYGNRPVTALLPEMSAIFIAVGPTASGSAGTSQP